MLIAQSGTSVFVRPIGGRHTVTFPACPGHVITSVTNQQPHNSLTASWNGRSRESGKLRGNRITYPPLSMTSSNINQSLPLSLSLSFTLPLFLSYRAIPLNPLFLFFKTHSIQLQPPFRHSPASPSFYIRRICESRACIRTGCPKAAQPFTQRDIISITEYSQHDCQHTLPKTRCCISIEPPHVGDSVLFSFSFPFSFPFLFPYIHVSRSEP